MRSGEALHGRPVPVLSDGRIKPIVDRSFALDDIAVAQAYVEPTTMSAGGDYAAAIGQDRPG